MATARFGTKQIEQILSDDSNTTIEDLRRVIKGLSKIQKGVFLQGYKSMTKQDLERFLRHWVSIQALFKTWNIAHNEWETIIVTDTLSVVTTPTPETMVLGGNNIGNSDSSEGIGVNSGVLRYRLQPWVAYIGVNDPEYTNTQNKKAAEALKESLLKSASVSWAIVRRDLDKGGWQIKTWLPISEKAKNFYPDFAGVEKAILAHGIIDDVSAASVSIAS